MRERERLLRGQVRRVQRLRNWDYRSPGVYFVTIVTVDRSRLFGDVVEGELSLNALGDLVRREWARTAELRWNVELDEFVVMPNHLHAIVHIRSELPRPRPASDRQESPYSTDKLNHSLSSIIRGFKAASTKATNEAREMPGEPVWHRGFHDRIIRDAGQLEAARHYIRNNPRNWPNDPQNG